MGYYKQQAVEAQYEADRIVAWWTWHDGLLPRWYMRWLSRHHDLFMLAIETWEQEPFAPKPASSHVALQQSRKELIGLERAASRKGLWWTVVALSAVVGGGITAAFILVGGF